MQPGRPPATLALAALTLATLACCGAPQRAELEAVVVSELSPINDTCPRSGKPVVADSLTEYRGHVIGFCNTHCRDDFAANVADRAADREFFDALIAEGSAPR